MPKQIKSTGYSTLKWHILYLSKHSKPTLQRLTGATR